MPVHAIDIGPARRLPRSMGQPAAPKRSPATTTRRSLRTWELERW